MDPHKHSVGNEPHYSKSELPAPTDDVVIAVVGSTGTGKSSFIQLLTGDTTVTLGHSLKPETSDVQAVRFLDPITKRNIIVIDTPGFADGATNTDILTQITNCPLSKYNKKRKLNGLVYLQRILDTKFTEQGKRNPRMFKGLCGTDFQNVIVLTTFWDQVDPNKGLRRENELKSNFNDIVAKGGHFMRHNHTDESARQVLGWILQKEIGEGKGLEDTNAKYVRQEEVDRLIIKHKQEVANIRAEMEAVKENYKEAIKELGEERAKLQKGLESERKSREQLEVEAKKEKEKYEEWHKDQERNLELRGLQAKLDQEQKERAKFQRELERLEAERSDLQKSLESEKKSREQREVEAKKENEKYEKWYQDQERILSAWLDSQAKAHSTEPRAMKAKLDQEQKDREMKEPGEERGNLQKELVERHEAERLVLQKGLKSEKQSREQLETEVKKENEKYGRWRKGPERTLSAQLDSQAKVHSAELKSIQAKLDQEQKDQVMRELVEDRARLQGVSGPPKRSKFCWNIWRLCGRAQ